MYCRDCGQEVKNGSKFCVNCGAKIIYKSVEPAPSSKTSGAASSRTDNTVRRENLGRKVAEERPKKSKTPLLIGIIVVLVIALIVVITMAINKNAKESDKNLNYELYNPEDIEDLTPQTAEEYDAYFDKLEYYTLGEEPEESDWEEEFDELLSEIENEE